MIHGLGADFALAARRLVATPQHPAHDSQGRLIPVAQGLAIGIFIGLAGRAIVRAYLDVKVNVVDPWMLLVVPVPLVLAVFCACYLPARRASRVDPNEALRHL